MSARRFVFAALVALAAPIAPAGAADYGTTVRATPGLVAYWPLDEPAGPVTDAIAGRTASLTADYARPPGIDTGTAVELSGSAAANFGNFQNFSADRSIEVWASARTTTADRYLVSKGTTSAGYHLYLAAGGIPTFQVNGTRLAAPALARAGWHQLAATLAGRAMTLYVDGAPVASGTVANTPFTSSQSLWLGRLSRSASGYWAGGLDEVSLYNRALDAATIAAHFAAGADTTPPQTLFTSAPAAVSDQSDGTIRFAGSKGGVSFTCALDGAAPAACAGAFDYSMLRDGAHTLVVQATDRWGTTAPSTLSWQIALPAGDTAAPVTTLTATPSSLTNSTVARFTFVGSKASLTFACRLDGGTWTACAGGTATLRGLTDGEHTFEVRATDRWGTVEAAPAAFRWTVDLTHPRTFLLVAQATSARPASAVVVSEPGATFECRSATGTWGACPASFSLPDLGTAYGLYVRSTDPAGNVEDGEASVVVEPAPTIRTSFLGEPVAFAISDMRFHASLRCSIDGGALVACPEPLVYAGLGYGAHTLKIVDGQGETTPFPTIAWTDPLPVPVAVGAQFPALLQLGTKARQASIAVQRLPRILFQSNVAGRARVSLSRGGRTLRSWGADVSPGSNALAMPRAAWRRLRPGRYGLTLTVRNAAGTSAAALLRFDAIRSTRR